MTDVTTLLAGIKTLEEAASDGPWYFEVGSGNVIREYVTDDGNEEADLVGNVEDSSDGSFIAAARTDVPRLVAALEAVTELHTPFVWDFGFGPVTSCRGCADQDVSEELATYPCPTITAVVAALGGGE